MFISIVGEIVLQEKKSLELLINSQKAQEVALKTHIQHLQEELENQESMVIFILVPIFLALNCHFELLWDIASNRAHISAFFHLILKLRH